MSGTWYQGVIQLSYWIYGFTCILKNIFIYNLVFVDWSGVTCHIVNVSKFNSILLCFSSKWQYMIMRNIKVYIKMLLTREMLGVEAVESKYALLFSKLFSFSRSPIKHSSYNSVSRKLNSNLSKIATISPLLYSINQFIN